MIRFLDPAPHWKKYVAQVRDFDAVLEYAKAVSTSLIGIVPAHKHIRYGEQIFVKLLGHCVTLRRIAPDPTRRPGRELWDAPSMSSVARCVIEAHDAFTYIALGHMTSTERDFRLQLWELHSKNRRAKMLRAIGSVDPRLSTIEAEEKILQDAITGSPFFTSISASVKQKILSGDPPPFHLTQRERCAMADVNFDYYNVVTMHLSQNVHTHPFSIQQLLTFRAGDADALAMMSLPLDYALPFLARVTHEMRNMFPKKIASPPSRTASKMLLWRTISAHGVKGKAS
jgi:hypothetical protein